MDDGPIYNVSGVAFDGSMDTRNIPSVGLTAPKHGHNDDIDYDRKKVLRCIDRAMVPNILDIQQYHL